MVHVVCSFNSFTSHKLAEQNDFFTNDIRQLSLKWFWLSIIITEHQKQSKTPKQPFLLLMLYDVQYLWSKLFLNDIFHHLNQLTKKLQGRDKSIMGLEELPAFQNSDDEWLLGGAENQLPLDLKISASQ